MSRPGRRIGIARVDYSDVMRVGKEDEEKV